MPKKRIFVKPSKKKRHQQLRSIFTDQLQGIIQQLIKIQAANMSTGLTELKKVVDNPANTLQQYVRWCVIPSGLLKDLKLERLNTSHGNWRS